LIASTDGTAKYQKRRALASVSFRTLAFATAREPGTVCGHSSGYRPGGLTTSLAVAARAGRACQSNVGIV
jgi:hypothetical protein